MARWPRYRRQLLKCAAAAVVLSNTGVTAAPAAELYTFQPPASWQDFTHTNFPDRAVAVWRGPTDAKFGENILILVKPDSGSLEQATDARALAAAMPGVQVSKQKMTVCGGHPAMYVYALAPWHGNTLISENIISVWGGMVYSATYSRLNYQETVADARSALTTLCPSSSSQTTGTSW